VTAPERLRLFIAAPVPDEWHAWLSENQRRLEETMPGYFRLTRPDTWHLTVLFLGTQPASMVPRVGEAVARVAASMSAFTLTASELGAPGPLDRPRLVWLRCDDGGVLAQAQHDLLAQLGDLRVETAPFRAHITLGRARKPARVEFKEAIAWLNRLARPSAESVDRLVLYRSHLERTGARYEALLECDLK
jgi:RNA 2',3'-cyclic 3'-phosphodiesterase